jgi:hypothetical protein
MSLKQLKLIAGAVIALTIVELFVLAHFAAKFW